jgi:hypothetical protein
MPVSYLAGGKLLLELDRLLRPGGYFVWSATPVYQKLPEDVEIWQGIPCFNFFSTVITVNYEFHAPRVIFVLPCCSHVCSNQFNVLENGQQSKG